MAAASPDVNNGARSKSDIYPCTRCQKHCSTGIKCNSCSMWTHNLCSELPTYYIVVLVNTNRRYTCLPCSKQNYSDFNSQAEEIDEIKQAEESHKTPLDPQCSSGLDITQNTGKTNITEPKEQTEAESIAGTSREVFGNTPEDMPLILPVSQTQSNSNPVHLDREATRTQETLHQSNQSENKRTKKSICKYYRQRKCKYGKRGTGCPFDHPRDCLKFTKFGMDKERGCRQGRHCKDFHPEMCNNSLHKSECLRENCRYMHVRGTVRQHKFTPNSSRDLIREKGRQTPSSCWAYEETNQTPKPLTKSKIEAPPDQQTRSSSFLEEMVQKIMDMENQAHIMISRLMERTDRLEMRQRAISNY